MAVQIVDQVTPTSDAPQRSQGDEDYSNTADAWAASITVTTTSWNASITQFNTAAIQVNQLAVDAQTSANDSATSAGESAASAVASEASASNSAASANNKGEWSALVGALNVPASVTHNGSVWILDTDLADVTASEPGVSGDWTETGASGATDAEKANITLNAFNIAVNGGLTVGNMVDGVVDTFTDATGTDVAVIQASKETGKYVLSQGDEFSLGGPPTFSGTSFSTSSPAGSPSGIAFNVDGTKMFIISPQTDAIWQYSLSIGFDLSSTVASTGFTFSVSAQGLDPEDVVFNPDGTKFFIIDSSAPSELFEYTCSVGFDLNSTIAYSGNSFDVSSQETAARGVWFNSDGTKFYIVGITTDTVYEYSVSVGFDLSSTVAYTGNSFSVNSQEDRPTGITFNPDGTLFFVIGDTNNKMFQYSLSVAFDLGSTVAYTGVNFSMAAQNITMGGTVFNSDGTKIFAVGATGTPSVFEYDVNGSIAVSSLTTADFTALAVPSNAYVVIHEDPAASITLNTDLQAWVSRTASKAFTTNPAVNNKITVAANGYSNGDRILLSQARLGMIPAELNTFTPYYIVNVATNDFELSLTEGGATITLTVAIDVAAGTRTLSVYSQVTLELETTQAVGSIISGTGTIATQVSGTTMHTAIISPTEKVIDLLALSTQWS